jgi:hypothetical protein
MTDTIYIPKSNGLPALAGAFTPTWKGKPMSQLNRRSVLTAAAALPAAAVPVLANAAIGPDASEPAFPAMMTSKRPRGIESRAAFAMNCRVFLRFHPSNNINL